MKVDEFMLEHDVLELTTSDAQAERKVTEIHVNIWHIPPCNDYVDTTNPGLLSFYERQTKATINYVQGEASSRLTRGVTRTLRWSPVQ